MARSWRFLVSCRWGLLLVLGSGTLLMGRIGDPLSRFSYDLPFLFRPKMERKQPVVLAFIYDSSLRKLGESSPGILDRRQHIRFLRSLTEAHAKVVFYDLIFSSPSGDPK